ncbi:LamG domain-containing protein [Marivita sp. GX14005]|uniref:LamG domain-containing protein n=1 Tax=Marivita sp. GX14005 TaxID=2942276 RepID=UPI002018E6AB|nr:LamG domain-containing protein [Marivita sp. GX14005]MCL3881740.1 LamG domain-containing protein [Marivita sp. GX14005]
MVSALLDASDATHIAISSGNWSDSSTWKGGEIPGKNAKVHIAEGVDVTYDVQSDARLEWVKVDGGLHFATNKDTHILVETMTTGHMSHLTVGTADKPMNAGVQTLIEFADGPFDTKADPAYLGHGLITDGKVEIHGAEKSPYAALIGDAKAGSKTLTFEKGTDGWQVGDKIVVMGTQLNKFQDETRTIVDVKETSKGLLVTFDKALSHDHTTPPGHDLKIYAGNETRNIKFTSENPDGIRGHVMLHNADVSVQFAEFGDLGRTDKSKPLNVGTNVEARYPLHLHETGTVAGSDMAVLNGNSVHDGPGWGIVQHSSNAAVDFNFVHSIAGAGIVSEDGDETGQWIGNFVTNIPGAGDDFSIERDELKADFGHSGVAYENQARQIIQQDNIAANSNTGWMFRGAETSVDNPDRDAIQFDPAPLSLQLNNEEPAIIGFHDNIAAAVETVLDTGHRQDAVTTTDLRSDMVGMTAWEVDRVFDIFSYTGEYVIRDGLFIGDDDGAGRAIVMPEKHEGTSIIDSHFEGFKTAIYDRGLNNDGVYIGNTFKDVKKKVDAKFYNESRLDSSPSSSLKPLDKPIVKIDSYADLTMGPHNHELLICGTITDTAGTLRLGSNKWTSTTTSDHDGIETSDDHLGHPEPEQLIEMHGAMRDGEGGWTMPFALWVTDRVTGEHFAYRIDIKLVGYSDEYLEQYEIKSFDLPTHDVEIFDDYAGGAGNHGGGHGSGEGHNPKPEPTPEQPEVTPDTPDTSDDMPDTGEDTNPPADGGSGDVPASGDGGTSAGKGKALEFKKTGFAIDDIKLSGDFTLEAWVQLAENKNISAADAILSGEGFEVNFRGGQLTVEADGDIIAKASVDAVDGAWTHYAVVRDDGQIRILADGKEVGTSKSGWNKDVVIDTLADGQNYSRGLVGTLDEVRVWDSARTNSEIDALRFSGSTASEATQPVKVFSFEDGASYGPNTNYVDSPLALGNGDGEPPTPDTAPKSVMEIGTTTFDQTDPDGWFKANFGEAIDDAIVVAGPLSNNGYQAAFARIQNTTDKGFQIQIEEWDYLDGRHAAETVSWMSVSEGSHTLEDGRQIIAQSVQTNKSGEATLDLSGLDGDFAFFTQIASHENDQAVTARTDVDANGIIEIDLQRQEGMGGKFAQETVNIIAVELGGKGTGFHVGEGSANHEASKVGFNVPFEEFAFIASMTSMKGGNTATLRMDGLDDGSASLFVQEEQARDAEIAHTYEDLSWFIAENGVYDLF